MEKDVRRYRERGMGRKSRIVSCHLRQPVEERERDAKVSNIDLK